VPRNPGVFLSKRIILSFPPLCYDKAFVSLKGERIHELQIIYGVLGFSSLQVVWYLTMDHAIDSEGISLP